MKKLLLSAAVMAGTLTACVYPFDPELDISAEKIPVVDGNIRLGDYSSLRLDYLMDLDGPIRANASGEAWIEDNLGNRYNPLSNSSSMQFDTREAPADRQYRAVVVMNGETYHSAWLTPEPAPEITGISFTADEDDVHVDVSLKSGASGSGYIGLSYEETWEFHSDFTVQYVIDPNSWTYSMLMGSYPFYWCFRDHNSQSTTLVDYSQLEGGEINHFPLLSFPRTDSRNHKRYSILVKAYSLSEEAGEYLRQTEEISQAGGSLFSPDPGALTGNLVCASNPEKEVLGLVKIGVISHKRAFLQGIYLKSVRPSEAMLILPREEDLYSLYYFENYRPVKDIALGDEKGIGWGPHRCINCIEAGGYQITPYFW